MSTALLKRILWLLTCLLISLFALIFIVHDKIILISVLVCMIIIAVSSWIFLGWNQTNKAISVGLEDIFEKLPSVSYRQPVILTVQQSFSELFTFKETVRLTDHGCYIFLKKLNDIDNFVENLLIQRPDWHSQLNMLLVIIPEQHNDMPILMGVLNEFYYQLNQIKKRSRSVVTSMIISCLTGKEGPWFEFTDTQQKFIVWIDGQTPVSYKDWLVNVSDQERQKRLFQFIEVNAWFKWFSQTIAREYNNVDHGYDPPISIAMTFTALNKVENSLWEQWVRREITLSSVAISKQENKAVVFPDFLFRLLPHQGRYNPFIRTALYASGIILIFLGCSFIGSYINNHHLLLSIRHDLERYNALPFSKEALKSDAFHQLEKDRDLLESYYRNGVPQRLDFGLYIGDILYPSLMEAINHYDPPKTKKLEPIQDVIHFDSMALFDVGQSTLKAGSTKLLVDALTKIRARPGWMIFITGHTDSTGNEDLNKKLSQDRAEAVETWMIENSDIPASCFAIQGFGSSKPIADNSTREGRAANRRVEVRLIKDRSACLSSYP